MDGFPPTAPPPPPGGAPMAPATSAVPGSPLPTPSAVAPEIRAQGRPSNDPERNAKRAKDAEAFNAFVGALPKKATDYKLAIYKMKGLRGSQREHRPCLKIFLSELEEATNAGDSDTEEYIVERLIDKYKDRKMRFICIPQDAHGKAVPKLAPFELAINIDEDDEEEEDEEELMLIEEALAEQGAPPPTPGYGNYSPPPPYPQQAPPSVLDQATNLLDRQRNAEQSNTTVMMTMMQQMNAQTQQSSALMLQMMQQQAADREAQAEKQRQIEREARERRDADERARSNERLQLMATLFPAVMPLFQKMMEGKEDKITPILLTKLMEGQDNRNSGQEMIAMMSEASKQQMLMQGEMSRQNMQQQSETQRSMISHVLKMAEESMKAQKQLDSTKEDSPLESFGHILSAVGPLLQNIQQTPQQMPAQNQVPVQQPQAALPTQQAPNPQPVPQSAPPQQEAPAGPPSRESMPHYTDEDWIRSGLTTIRQLQDGTIPPERRWDALAWMSTVLPHSLLEAVIQNDEQAIMMGASSVVMADADIQAWLGQEGADDYLRDALSDLGAVLRQEVTDMQAQDTINKERFRLGMESEPANKRNGSGKKMPPPPPVEDTVAEEVIAEENVDFPPTDGMPIEVQEVVPASVVEETAVNEEVAADANSDSSSEE